jgi:uncharacterized protein
MTAAFEEQLSLACELQSIDLDLFSLRQRLDALPAKLSELEAAFGDVRQRLEAARSDLVGVEKQRRTDEVELTASVDHLREREAKLYAIKTNREYQAALKEISEGKRLNREREDRILQAMERIEALTKEITQLEQDFAEKEGALKAEQEGVRQEETELKKRMDDEMRKRPEIIARIEKATIRTYDVVRQHYADAIVEVAQGICQGCSRRVPPQLYNEMLRREGFKACPNCQRLLYVSAATLEGDANAAGQGS